MKRCVGQSHNDDMHKAFGGGKKKKRLSQGWSLEQEDKNREKEKTEPSLSESIFLNTT